MEKPIIATTLAGLFVQRKPWKEAHKAWFEAMAKRLDDPTLLDWIPKQDFFPGVLNAMQRLYPTLSEAEWTIKARESFFQAVVHYIRDHPEVRNDAVVSLFKQLKHDYRIALVTTNTKDATSRILDATGLEGLFDLMEPSVTEEQNDKVAVLQRFLDREQKPVLYVGSDRTATYDACKAFGIPALYANLEGDAPIAGVETVTSVHELAERLKHISAKKH